MDSLSSKKRVRSNSDDSGVDSVDAKKILLDILDDSDITTPSHDLDSFIQSFQNEISPTFSSSSPSSPAPEAAGKSSGDRPELGFLFEASDDELGLPPTESTRVLAESVGLSELWGLDDELFARYDSFEYGFVDDNNSYSNGEYVTLDGLFDHTDLGFGSSDLTWRPETLPAQ
ncbi:hypothetical protein QVD17_31936 [Tagetes erecta]|uniref:Uncharacterized protein n=1 Tax=Tagetes erecta TaxID=13708 RepID=A0AAD8NPS7_TARER|nr:hypothetical protein QVD17_31936 [Tagetes erecta]